MRAGRGKLQNQRSLPLCPAYDFILESLGAFPRPFDICAALAVSVVACTSLLATKSGESVDETAKVTPP